MLSPYGDTSAKTEEALDWLEPYLNTLETDGFTFAVNCVKKKPFDVTLKMQIAETGDWAYIRKRQGLGESLCVSLSVSSL